MDTARSAELIPASRRALLQRQEQLSDASRAHELIDQGKTRCSRIDAGFAQKLRNGRQRRCSDCGRTNSNTALIASSYVSQIALGFAQQHSRTDRAHCAASHRAGSLVQLEQRPCTTRTCAAAGFSFRRHRQPDYRAGDHANFVAVVREREIGTLEQIMVTPSVGRVILGKTLPFFPSAFSTPCSLAPLYVLVPDSVSRHFVVLLTGAVLFLICMLAWRCLFRQCRPRNNSDGDSVLRHHATITFRVLDSNQRMRTGCNWPATQFRCAIF